MSLNITRINGSLPPAICEQKWGDGGGVFVPTRHPCMHFGSGSNIFIDDVNICGMALCIPCTKFCSVEGSKYCPSHNTPTSMPLLSIVDTNGNTKEIPLLKGTKVHTIEGKECSLMKLRNCVIQRYS